MPESNPLDKYVQDEQAKRRARAQAAAKLATQHAQTKNLEIEKAKQEVAERRQLIDLFVNRVSGCVSPISFRVESLEDHRRYSEELERQRHTSWRSFNSLSSKLHKQMLENLPVRVGWQIIDESREVVDFSDRYDGGFSERTVYRKVFVTTDGQLVISTSDYHNHMPQLTTATIAEGMANFLIEHDAITED